MRSIYKYDIINSENGIVEGPITKILCADSQHGSIKVWAEVDTTLPNRKFEVYPIGTGWPLDPPVGQQCVLDCCTYLNTIQLAGGSLIFHVYYREITQSPLKKSDDTKKSKNKSATFTTSNCKINQNVLEKFI